MLQFRYNIINHLIDKYDLTKYLEIGVFNGENFREIRATLKHGVDPGSEGIVAKEVTHPYTSDRFFESLDKNYLYDIIFIDGLHHADQVATDIKNSLKHISPNGFIVLHDCLPPDYDHQVVPRKQAFWTGDVWRAFVGFKQANSLFSCVVDMDFGVGIIKNNPDVEYKDFSPTTMSYEEFANNSKELLNLISYQEFISSDI
jgi:hypothetical protein